MKRILRLLSLHGPVGTLQLALAMILGAVLYFTPARRQARAALRDQDLEFDRLWGVDTSGKFVPDIGDVIGPNWTNGCRYQAVHAELLKSTLDELRLDFQRFTFLDFGSGKGRAVLAASQLPFHQVIGVEYSQTIDRIARQNLRIFPETARRCADVQLVCADATQFPIPAGPLILFVNNSFGASLIAEVAKNLDASYQQQPRRIIVLYFNAFFPGSWKVCRALSLVKATGAILIYDSVSHAA